jgi:hypothetical protein
MYEYEQLVLRVEANTPHKLSKLPTFLNNIIRMLSTETVMWSCYCFALYILGGPGIKRDAVNTMLTRPPTDANKLSAVAHIVEPNGKLQVNPEALRQYLIHLAAPVSENAAVPLSDPAAVLPSSSSSELKVPHVAASAAPPALSAAAAAASDSSSKQLDASGPPKLPADAASGAPALASELQVNPDLVAPVPESAAHPAAQPAAQPVAHPAAQPVAQPAASPLLVSTAAFAASSSSEVQAASAADATTAASSFKPAPAAEKHKRRKTRNDGVQAITTVRLEDRSRFVLRLSLPTVLCSAPVLAKDKHVLGLRGSCTL